MRQQPNHPICYQQQWAGFKIKNVGDFITHWVDWVPLSASMELFYPFSWLLSRNLDDGVSTLSPTLTIFIRFWHLHTLKNITNWPEMWQHQHITESVKSLPPSSIQPAEKVHRQTKQEVVMMSWCPSSQMPTFYTALDKDRNWTISQYVIQNRNGHFQQNNCSNFQ